VGIYLDRHLSDHGKLYTAVSRPTSEAGIKMIIHSDGKQGYHEGLKQWFTHNFVDKEICDLTLDDVLPHDYDFNPHPAVVRAEADVRLLELMHRCNYLCFSAGQRCLRPSRARRFP
jgi:hypothetical protein